MIEFAYPWFVLALPLPWLIERLVPAYRRKKDALRVPFYQQLLNISGAQEGTGAVVAVRTKIGRIALIIVWALMIVALAKPESVAEPIVHQQSARDLMVAVDLSGSMQNTDFQSKEGQQIDRLSAVKGVLAEFVAQREHDRLGLIVFGDAPFLQAPFTVDHATWLVLLNETQIGMAGNNTALGDAIGLSLKHFLSNDSDNRVLILLSDGNDTGSKVPPIDAAKVAAQHKVTIYPIAIGDPSTQGEKALDTKTLQRVAELTGGEFYQASDRETLQKVYLRITALQPQLFESKSFRPRTSLHHYPVLMAFLLMFVAGIYHLAGLMRQAILAKKLSASNNKGAL